MGGSVRLEYTDGYDPDKERREKEEALGRFFDTSTNLIISAFGKDQETQDAIVDVLKLEIITASGYQLTKPIEKLRDGDETILTCASIGILMANPYANPEEIEPHCSRIWNEGFARVEEARAAGRVFMGRHLAETNG